MEDNPELVIKPDYFKIIVCSLLMLALLVWGVADGLIGQTRFLGFALLFLVVNAVVAFSSYNYIYFYAHGIRFRNPCLFFINRPVIPYENIQSFEIENMSRRGDFVSLLLKNKKTKCYNIDLFEKKKAIFREAMTSRDIKDGAVILAEIRKNLKGVK